MIMTWSHATFDRLTPMKWGRLCVPSSTSSMHLTVHLQYVCYLHNDLPTAFTIHRWYSPNRSHSDHRRHTNIIINRWTALFLQVLRSLLCITFQLIFTSNIYRVSVITSFTNFCSTLSLSSFTVEYVGCQICPFILTILSLSLSNSL